MPRQTDSEKSFGNFSIYDDTDAFHSCRFLYPDLSFDRLTKMVAFNLENNIHIIRREMAEIVEINKKRGRQ